MAPIRVPCFYVDPAPPARPVTVSVLLARHGSHDEVGRVLSGRSEIALNAAGRAEAERLADRLASTPLVAVHSSPRPRARETAHIIAGRHGLPVDIIEALDEIDFGAWTGRSFASLEGDPRWSRWNEARRSTCPPGGEAMTDAVQRATAHLETVASGTLCVSHCDIVRGIAAHYLGLDLDRMLGFDVDPASLTTLALHPGGGRVVALNERCA